VHCPAALLIARPAARMTANAKAIATTWYDLDSAVYFDSSFKLFALISPIKVTHEY
jgi:hypothetical protein